MKKVVEFRIENERLKKYLIESLQEEKIEFRLDHEDRWNQHVKTASEFYQVYCLYVNEDDFEKANKIVDGYEKATIVTEGIKELEDAEEIEANNKYRIFTMKNYYKLGWGLILLLGIILAIIIYFYQ